MVSRMQLDITVFDQMDLPGGGERASLLLPIWPIKKLPA